jgi:hypothetical protein
LRGTRAKILAVAALAIIALVVGLTVWLTSDTTEAAPSHTEYLQLYQAAAVGQKESTLLQQWPKKPYQSYHDGTGHRCYEWLEMYDNGKSRALYDLCFKKGLLTSKFHP